MRKITSLLLLLLCAVTVLSARENKYDRGIVMKTFIPKGQWMVGATFSYSEHVDDNFEFMSLLKDIDSEGYTFKVTPLVSYFIRDNISIGGRLAYSRSYTKLDNLSLSLGDDISLDINEMLAQNMSSTIRLIMISRCSARDATSPMIPSVR